jgi:hypothetical protein
MICFQQRIQKGEFGWAQNCKYCHQLHKLLGTKTFPIIIEQQLVIGSAPYLQLENTCIVIWCFFKAIYQVVIFWFWFF